jgi:hypothetical protein
MTSLCIVIGAMEKVAVNVLTVAAKITLKLDFGVSLPGLAPDATQQMPLTELLFDTQLPISGASSRDLVVRWIPF